MLHPSRNSSFGLQIRAFNVIRAPCLQKGTQMLMECTQPFKLMYKCSAHILCYEVDQEYCNLMQEEDDKMKSELMLSRFLVR